jgi:two-component system NtrC family sensor kinase
VNELIRNTCRFMRYDRRYRRIELVANLDPKIPALRLVGDQFVQVFMNLLINAADAFDAAPASPPNVTITTRLMDSSVLVQVADNGAGMDAATLNQAFEPFFTTKPVGHGSGLGLAVCKSIVEAHGGSLTLESKVGDGTTVNVLLPVGDGRGTAGGGKPDGAGTAGSAGQRPSAASAT